MRVAYEQQYLEIRDMTNFEEIDIVELLPQRPPMVMVGKILSCESNRITTRFTISEENVFSYNGNFQESGLIENIAQTAAALSGYQAKLNNEKVKLGFIGSIRNLDIFSLPEVGSEIETSVEVIGQVMNVDMIKGEIRLNNEVIAQCEMRIFLENN